MRKMRIKIVAILGLCLTFSSFNGMNVEAMGIEKIEQTACEECSMMNEIDFSNLVPLEESSSNEEFSLAKNVKISTMPVDGNEIILTINNEEDYSLDKWTIVYEASYTVLNAINANIISGSDVIELKADETNDSILSNESKEITLTIDGDYTDVESYRVYALASDESNRQVVDTITYDAISGKSELEIEKDDTADTLVELQENNRIDEDVKALTEFEDFNRAEIDKVFGKDQRTKVTTVDSSPYSRIACLIITWSDNTVSQGTGFMISPNYMLTAGHCVYNTKLGKSAKSISAYFGANGNGYSKKVDATNWSWCASYPSNNSVANDWGAIKLSSNPGRGYFSIGYASDASLKKTSLTVCGYPGDKAVANSNSSINGRSRYMYKMSSKPSKVDTTAIYYTLDTYNGQSGAPIYNSSNKVYGIHTRGDSSNNSGRRFTSSLVKAFKDKGRCN